MNKSQEKDQNNAERKPPARSAFPPAWILVVFLVVATSLLLIQGQRDKRDEITQTHFERQIAQKRVDQPVEIVGKAKIWGSFIKDDSGRYPYKEKVRDEDFHAGESAECAFSW